MRTRGSSVYSHINSVLRGGINARCNPPSQLSFAQPTVVHHFNPYGTPGNNTASTADTTHAPTTPGRTVDYPSFPTYHTPFMAVGSSDINLLMASVARNVESTDPFSHTPPHVPMSSHDSIHTKSPGVSTSYFPWETSGSSAFLGISTSSKWSSTWATFWYYWASVSIGSSTCIYLHRLLRLHLVVHPPTMVHPFHLLWSSNSSFWSAYSYWFPYTSSRSTCRRIHCFHALLPWH